MPTVQAAEALGINLVASASLLQSKMTRGLPSFIADAFGLQTDAERAIQFVRSSPQILTSAGRHEPCGTRAGQPAPGQRTRAATAEQYSRLFRPRPKKHERSGTMATVSS